MSNAGQGDTLVAMAAAKTAKKKRKQPWAVEMGRRRAAKAAPGEMAAIGQIGGIRGGEARAAALTKKRRSEIARLAAAARWK